MAFTGGVFCDVTSHHSCGAGSAGAGKPGQVCNERYIADLCGWLRSRRFFGDCDSANRIPSVSEQHTDVVLYGAVCAFPFAGSQ